MSMNIAIGKAMLREQFQRTQLILILSLGIGAVPCLILYVVRRFEAAVSGGAVMPDTELAVFSIFWAYLVGILGLLYCHSDARDIELNIPSYLLRLPVRTFDLVLFRMGYGLLCVALIGIWGSGVQYLLFGEKMEVIFTFWTPMLIGVTAFALLQALAWCIGGSGFGVIVTALIINLLVDWLVFDFDSELGDMTGTMTGDAVSLVAISFLAAYVGVRTRRREGFDVSRALGPLFSIFARDRGVDRAPFASPEEAMRWFEWRRQGRMLPTIVLCGSIVFSIIALAQLPAALSGQYPWNTAMTIYSVAIAMAFYTALGATALFFGSYTFFQNQRIQLGAQKTFLFIRPVSTKDLASARIAATLRSVLITVPPFVIVCAITVFFAARSDDLNGFPGFVQERIGLEGAAIAVLLLLGFTAAIWCAQWFGNILASLAILAGPAILFSILFEAGIVSEATGNIYTARIFSAIAIPGCVYLFYLAHRRGHLKTKHALIAVATLPFLLTGWFTFMNWDNILNAEPYEFTRIAHILPFAILPILPFATVPLIMQYARHR